MRCVIICLQQFPLSVRNYIIYMPSNDAGVITHLWANFNSGVTASTHYGDVIMGAIASQITSLVIFYSTVYWGADRRKHQSSASLAFVQGIHRGPVNSPHKGPVTRNMFPFDDVIMDMVAKYHLTDNYGTWLSIHDTNRICYLKSSQVVY